jgi:hypothetical protein
MDTLDKQMIHVLSRMEYDGFNFHYSQGEQRKCSLRDHSHTLEILNHEGNVFDGFRIAMLLKPRRDCKEHIK